MGKRPARSSRHKEALVCLLARIQVDLVAKAASTTQIDNLPPKGLVEELLSGDVGKSTVLALHAWFVDVNHKAFDALKFAATVSTLGLNVRLLYELDLSQRVYVFKKDTVEVLLKSRVVVIGPKPTRDFVVGAVFGDFELNTFADVTRRYRKSDWSACLKKRTLSTSRFLENELLTRPRSNDWAAERDSMVADCAKERMPTSIEGFSKHESLTLSRSFSDPDSKKILKAGARPVGRFKGEDVYLKSHVLPLRTELGWRTIGRTVNRTSEKPRKILKSRPLYDESQTFETVRGVVNEGSIPKNEYGNVELFLPRLLPEKATHIKAPCPFVEEACVELNVDFAQAVVGFKKSTSNKYTPQMDGFVVATEFASEIVRLATSMKEIRLEHLRLKRSEEVLKWWGVLAKKLELRKALAARYSAVRAVESSDDAVYTEYRPEARASDVCAHKWGDTSTCEKCGMHRPVEEEL